MVDPLVEAYLIAVQDYRFARWRMVSAESRFRSLIGTLGENQAYEVAGVGFADRRCLRTHQCRIDARLALLKAYPSLKASASDGGCLGGTISFEMLAARGAIGCSEILPRPSNNNQESRRRRRG